VDTRADIYSLGVMLYELLVGHLPVDPVEVGLYEFLARLASGDTNAPTPSMGLATAAAKSESIAQRRRTDPHHLKQELRGDLDWIVMKAMHPDRSLRYETANALGLDIKRHLANEPVTARPPSTKYRLEKFVRRHRVGVITASVASVLVVASSVTATEVVHDPLAGTVSPPALNAALPAIAVPAERMELYSVESEELLAVAVAARLLLLSETGEAPSATVEATSTTISTFFTVAEVSVFVSRP
jgi:serine/threonine protein kinase